MRRVGMGLVGPGFVAAHHIDAVRRLGFVDVVAIAGADVGLTRHKADALGVPKAYGSFADLVADPHATDDHRRASDRRRAATFAGRAATDWWKWAGAGSRGEASDHAYARFLTVLRSICFRALKRRPL